MSREPAPAEVYQVHVWRREISPMIWRRLLVALLGLFVVVPLSAGAQTNQVTASR